MLGLFVGRLWKGNAGPIALVGLLYLLTLVGFERDGLWTSDNAAKFLQVQALLKLSGAPEVDYERYSGGIPGLESGQGQQENIFQEQDSLEFVPGG